MNYRCSQKYSDAQGNKKQQGNLKGTSESKTKVNISNLKGTQN